MELSDLTDSVLQDLINEARQELSRFRSVALVFGELSESTEWGKLVFAVPILIEEHGETLRNAKEQVGTGMRPIGLIGIDNQQDPSATTLNELFCADG